MPVTEAWLMGVMSLPWGFDRLTPIMQLELFALKLGSKRLTALVDEIRTELLLGQAAIAALEALSKDKPDPL